MLPGPQVSYDTAKHVYLDLGMPDNTALHFSAGLTAGFAATVLGSPWDVIGTRLMARSSPPNGERLPGKASASSPVSCQIIHRLCPRDCKNQGRLRLRAEICCIVQTLLPQKVDSPRSLKHVLHPSPLKRMCVLATSFW